LVISKLHLYRTFFQATFKNYFKMVQPAKHILTNNSLKEVNNDHN